MSQATTDQLKLIDARPVFVRVLLIIPLALALWGAWCASHWYLGNVLASFAPGVDEGGIESTRRAMEYAPGDPLVYWSAANLQSRILDPNRTLDTLRLYEEAVRRSPRDYLYWMELGRARERAGDADGGEKALRRAIELAPSYAAPHWHLGNLLLRANKPDAAFAELRNAADASPLVMRPQVFEAAWSAFDKNVGAMESLTGGSAAARAQLAAFLASHERAADAVRLWTGLSAAEKKEQLKTGEDLMKALFEKKQFKAARELARDLGQESAEGVGQFANGGFENVISPPNTSLFGWQIAQTPQIEVARDPNQPHSGNASLRVIFNGFSKPYYYNITQVVVVEPQTRYRFEGYVRTQDLKSGGTPLLEVADAGDLKILGTSQAFPLGRNEWQLVTIEFSTPAQTEGVYVRTNRAYCGEVCPIYGIIWYDDFNLQRLGQAGGAG